MIILTNAEYLNRINDTQREVITKTRDVNHTYLKRMISYEVVMTAFIGTNHQERYVEEYITSIKRYIKSKL